MTSIAVGFARPDRNSWNSPPALDHPWHAVEVEGAPDELDGVVAVAVCGATVQIWGSHDWSRTGARPSACPTCAGAVGSTAEASARRLLHAV